MKSTFTIGKESARKAGVVVTVSGQFLYLDKENAKAEAAIVANGFCRMATMSEAFGQPVYPWGGSV